MKKFLKVFVILLIFQHLCVGVNALSIEKVIKNVNLENISPKKVNGVIYIPQRTVFEALDWEVSFNPTENTIICSKDSSTMEFSIGSSEFYIDGNYNIMNAPLIILENRAYIPQKFIVDQFGVKIKWNKEDNLIIMSDKNFSSVTVSGGGNLVITGDSIIVNIFEPCTVETLNDLTDYADNLININPYEALVKYKEIIDNLNREEVPDLYARVMNNMGNAYSMLAKFSNTKTNILNAIESYKNAIEFYLESDDVSNYNILLINLGNAYSILAEVTQDNKYLSLSIDNYKKAMEYYTRETFPLDYALALYNLGKAYKLQGMKDLSYNCFKISEEVYREALSHYSLKAIPKSMHLYRII